MPELELLVANESDNVAGEGADSLPRLEQLRQSDAEDFLILSKPDGEQPMLFPSEELQVPKKPAVYDELLVPTGGIDKYRKGISALHSIPVSGSHTLNSRRLMDAIVALVQIHFKRLPKHQVDTLREMHASPLFRVTKGELRETAGISSKDFGRVETALEMLSEMKISWNILGEDQQLEWKMTSRFLSTYGLGVGRRQYEVCFSVDPRVLDLILEPSLWATLATSVQKQLGTEASYNLYQQAWRYIRTAKKVTAEFPTATWIELISGPCRYVKTDEVTGAKEAVEYSEWKSRYLLPAMEKVNSVSALAHTLELIETKGRLKVKRLQFKFVPKQQEKLDLPLTWPDPIVESLKSLGFVEDEIAEMAQGFSLDEVVESLNRFRAAEVRMKQTNQRIGAPKQFFNGILDNVNTASVLADEELVAMNKKTRAAEAERQAAEDRERASSEFNSRQTRLLQQNFGQLSKARQADLLQDFEQGPDFAKAKLLLRNGWENAGVGAWTVLKTWLFRTRIEDFNELLPNPEDQTMEAWLLWRLGGGAD